MPTVKHGPSTVRRAASSRPMILNVLILVLAVVVAVLAWSLVRRTLVRPPVETLRVGGKGSGAAEVIQLDVLNGCGASGAANLCTSFLRARGYDVVEIRNFKSFDVDESLVVDRTGNRENAERVAYALGIRTIVQQITPDYYVDVSVVIGKDYRSLKLQQEEALH